MKRSTSSVLLTFSVLFSRENGDIPASMNRSFVKLAAPRTPIRHPVHFHCADFSSVKKSSVSDSKVASQLAEASLHTSTDAGLAKGSSSDCPVLSDVTLTHNDSSTDDDGASHPIDRSENDNSTTFLDRLNGIASSSDMRDATVDQTPDFEWPHRERISALASSSSSSIGNPVALASTSIDSATAEAGDRPRVWSQTNVVQAIDSSKSSRSSQQEASSQDKPSSFRRFHKVNALAAGSSSQLQSPDKTIEVVEQNHHNQVIAASALSPPAVHSWSTTRLALTATFYLVINLLVVMTAVHYDLNRQMALMNATHEVSVRQYQEMQAPVGASAALHFHIHLSPSLFAGSVENSVDDYESRHSFSRPDGFVHVSTGRSRQNHMPKRSKPRRIAATALSSVNPSCGSAASLRFLKEANSSDCFPNVDSAEGPSDLDERSVKDFLHVTSSPHKGLIEREEPVNTFPVRHTSTLPSNTTAQKFSNRLHARVDTISPSLSQGVDYPLLYTDLSPLDNRPVGNNSAAYVLREVPLAVSPMDPTRFFSRKPGWIPRTTHRMKATPPPKPKVQVVSIDALSKVVDDMIQERLHLLGEKYS